MASSRAHPFAATTHARRKVHPTHADLPPPVAPAADLPPGLSLHRLLCCARLTPGQAALVAADVWHEVERRTAAGHDVQRLSTRDVRVTTEGRAVLDTPPAADSVAAIHPDPPAALGPILAELTDALCEPPANARGDPDAEVREALAEAREDGPAGTRPALDRLARAAVAGEQASRAGLAALVTAWGSVADHPGSRRPVAGPAPARYVPLRPVARAAWRATWRLVALLTVLALVVGVEVTTLRSRLEQDLQLLLGAPATASPHPSAPSPTPPPVPTAGPAAAGAVRGVTLRSVHPCHPGHTCALSVSVRLRPATKPVPVRWSFRVVDRCTGATTTRHGDTVRVRADGERVVAVRQVRLPRGDALAVLAVTRRPARAASSVLLVPATGATCGS